jgi:type IV pilus assembly protein PilV
MNHFSASSQSGFNLVEVLVALVVLSFGLLGIAGLQITGVRGSQSSLYRSQAVVFMSDMSERIYSNRPGALAGAYAALNSGGLNCDSTTA